MVENKDKTLFCKKIVVGKRKRPYYFKIKGPDERMAYLLITQLMKTSEKEESDQIVVFLKHIPGFIVGLGKALTYVRGNIKTKLHDDEIILPKYSNANKRWSNDEERILMKNYLEGATIYELVKILKRSPRAIRLRLVNLILDI